MKKSKQSNREVKERWAGLEVERIRKLVDAGVFDDLCKILEEGQGIIVEYEYTAVRFFKKDGKLHAELPG